MASNNNNNNPQNPEKEEEKEEKPQITRGGQPRIVGDEIITIDDELYLALPQFKKMTPPTTPREKGKKESREGSSAKPGPLSSKKKEGGGNPHGAASSSQEKVGQVSPGTRSRSISPRRTRSSSEERLPGVSGPLANILKEQRERQRQGPEPMDLGDADLGGSQESVASDKSGATAKKDGRGRPPTTGLYIGVGAARKELQKRHADDAEMECLKKKVRAEVLAREEREAAGLPPEMRPIINKCNRTSHTAPPSNRSGEDSSDEEDSRTAPKAVMKRLEEQVAKVSKVAKDSSNLKGTFVKLLKDATAAILEEAAILRDHSRTNENRRLERANKKLREEIKELKKEMADLRKAWRTKEFPPSPYSQGKEKTPKTSPQGETSTGVSNSIMEQMTATIIKQVGVMMNARFEALEDRLPKERPLRPPLQHEREGKEMVSRKGKEAMTGPFSVRGVPGEGATRPADQRPTGSGVPGSGDPRREEGLEIEMEMEVYRSSPDETVPSASTQTTETTVSWSQVVKGRKGRKKGGQTQPPVTMAANSGQNRGLEKTPTSAQTVTGKKKGLAAVNLQQQQQQKDQGEQQLKQGGQQSKQQQQQPQRQQLPKQQQQKVPQQQQQQGQQQAQQPAAGGKTKSRRANKAPAVLLTLPQDGTISMAEAMTEVRGKVTLKDFEIERVRPKKSVTGAMILEVPGPEAAPKADRLAARIAEVLADKGVKVTRPVRTAEIRLTGMDDSVSPGQVQEAIVRVTKCTRDSIKVGNMVASSSGLFSLWAKCPQTVADKLGDSLLVGWVCARVTRLPQRPLQCFKCLEAGHAGAACTSIIDRSKRCYRCGEEGHVAGGCNNPPKCPLCKDQGKPAVHRYGGKACPASKLKGRITRPPIRPGTQNGRADEGRGNATVPPSQEDDHMEVVPLEEERLEEAEDIPIDV